MSTSNRIRFFFAEERLAVIHELTVEDREGKDSSISQAARLRWENAFAALNEARNHIYAAPAKNWDDVVARAECLRASLLWAGDKPACCTPGEEEYDDYQWRAVRELLEAVLSIAGRPMHLEPEARVLYDTASKVIEAGPTRKPDLYRSYLGMVGLTDERHEVAHV